MPAVRARLISILARRTRTSEPADGWFTLQTEAGEGVVSEAVTIAALRGEAVHRGAEHGAGSSAGRSQSVRGHGGKQTIFFAIMPGRRWLSAVSAVIGALAATAILSVSSHSTNDRTLIAAQRAEIAQLSAQRDRALVSARQAQSGQAAWRAQAMRWKSRALARTPASGRRRSTRGRRQTRRSTRATVRRSTRPTLPRG